MITFLYHLSKIAGICTLLLIAWMLYSGWKQGEEMDEEDFDEWSGYL